MKDPERGIQRIIWWLIVPLIVAVVSGIVIAKFDNDPTPAATSEFTPSSDEFSYTVKLISEVGSNPISNAELDLNIGNQHFQKNSDLNGQATFRIPNLYSGRMGDLNIKIDGENIGFLEVNLAEEFSPNEISINLESAIPEINTPTPTPSSAPSATNLPTKTPTAIPSPVATHENTPTQTATASATPTLVATTNAIVPEVLIVVAPKGTAVNVYTQPSSITGAPRAQVVQNDILLILETEDNWYRVQIQKNNIEGWIENKPEDIQLFSGTPPATLPSGSTPATSIPSTCITVFVTRNSISNDFFDDVTLNWQNPPIGTHELQIIVTGINSNGEEAFVVPSAISDLNSPYTIQQWMFEAGNFTFNSTFTFYVNVLDSESNQICQTIGNFEQ
ncbi:MAG: hypothetical protein H6654_16785 [Ardenticatenaceae bacterium]|nr:hypothetical protein [Anaerolineales bacterium]MCB8939698.1 hypothetical protein [Ardenticatenaceae bacterium]MCB8975218.1 hypothetical protein [Ardenticatenaceae bacterium]